MPDFAGLLLALDDLSEEAALAKVREEYDRLYVARSPLKTHDGQRVVFWADRFEHAFYSTPDRVNRLYAKAVFSRERGARVLWIGELLRCSDARVECWQVKPKAWLADRTKRSRLYVVWDLGYVVWLEPRKESGWKFSTAYVAHKKDIARYTREGFRIWPAQKRMGDAHKNAP